jgi:hypothetical protein
MPDPELAFELAWLGVTEDDPRSRATFASLTFTAGRDRIPVTEVDDGLAQTVRPDIRVPIYPLAQWFVVNWWRLRWEPYTGMSPTWLRAHAMASVSTDVPWPPLRFASDGAFIQLEARAERIRDVAAVRYLREVDLRIPADHFERAVDGLLAQVDARIASCVPGDTDLTELIAELNRERTDPRLARDCKLQALAGLDPGMAPAEWLRNASALADAAGRTTGDEVIASIPALRDGLSGAIHAVEAMKRSSIDVQLIGANEPADGAAAELPWQRGRRLAAQFRLDHGIGEGPVSMHILEQLLGVRLPLPVSATSTDRALIGGYRNGDGSGRTRILVATQRPDNQRFYLGRLIGAAFAATARDHVLPVTNADTAFQKFERSFAQELLCPWQVLDAYTDEHGTDDDGIAAAAEHFEVSEHLVLSTLINNGKLDRNRLPFS